MNPNASIYDSVVYGSIFSSQATREIWSDGARIQHYLDMSGRWPKAKPSWVSSPPRPVRRSAGTAMLRRWSSTSCARRLSMWAIPSCP